MYYFWLYNLARFLAVIVVTGRMSYKSYNSYHSYNSYKRQPSTVYF